MAESDESGPPPPQRLASMRTDEKKNGAGGSEKSDKKKWWKPKNPGTFSFNTSCRSTVVRQFILLTFLSKDVGGEGMETGWATRVHVHLNDWVQNV